MMWTYQAKLDKVIDADTALVILDLGFQLAFTVRVRLAGGAEGRTARQWALEWFDAHGHGTSEWPFTITTRPRNPKDRYGCWLATITAQGDTIHADLLAAGHAVPWPRPRP